MEPKPQQKQNSVKVFFRRSKRYSFLMYLALILVVVFLIPRSESLLASIDILKIKKISMQTISGDEPDYVRESEIEEIFSSHLGQNYFTFESEPLQKELLEKSAFIKEAIVSKQFPDKIAVDIVEREPFVVTRIDEQSCILLDGAAYTLQVSTYSEDEECTNTAKEYSVPVLTIEDSKLVFKENEQSSFYVVEDILKVVKVLNEYGYAVEGMKMDDQVLIMTVNDKRTISLSLNQSVDTQLERFIAVVGQIEHDNLDFKGLDLRYKRPVLKRK